MLITILSNFDNRVGPRIMHKYPNIRTDLPLDHVPLLMDLYKEGFFIHEFGEVKTANFIFEVPSPLARGRYEVLMVSIVSIEDQYGLNLSSYRELLEYLANKLSNTPELYKGLHQKEVPGGIEKFNEITNSIISFHETLPDERAIFKQHLSKLISHGLTQLGEGPMIGIQQDRLQCFKKNSFLLKIILENYLSPEILDFN